MLGRAKPTVGGRPDEATLGRAVPMENGHLMPERQHLKFQGGPTPKPEGDQRNYRGQDR
jgi:hypothetical protein